MRWPVGRRIEDDSVHGLPQPVALMVSCARPSRLDTAAKWLEGLLSRGPLAATDVERMALAAGFSKRTLERARRSLRIATSNCGQGTPWIMRLAGEDEAGEAREMGRADTAH